MNPATPAPRPTLHVNWPHLLLLAALPPFVWASGRAGLHRWHHSIHPAEALNYGTAIPLWDQVFGTWRAPGAHLARAWRTRPGARGHRGRGGRRGLARVAGACGGRVWRALLLAPLCGRCGPVRR